MPVLVVRLAGELVLYLVVMLLLWLSLAVPSVAVALLGALVVVVLRLPAVPVLVPSVRPALLRAPRRSLCMLVGIVVLLPALLVSALKFVLACRVRKKGKGF